MNLLQIFLILLLPLLSCPDGINQDKGSDISQLESQLDALFNQKMMQDQIPGAAFILIKDGRVLLKKGYGQANLAESSSRVNPDSTIFRIGSITKTFTATALMQLADQKRIDLGRNINHYLSSVKVPDTYTKPVTAAHLLSHSAGLDELRIRRRVFSKDEVIPLAEFLMSRIIRARPAGQVPAYSTYGMALAGLLVEEVSGITLENYLQKQVWEPLDMKQTSIDVPKQQQAYLAMGYELQGGINVAQPWEWYHTFPASSINSTATDMAKYMQMHLNAGQLDNATILSRPMALEMQRQQITGHPQVNGFCYGFYENRWSGQRTLEHGGDMLGFSAYMVLVPTHNMGIFVVNHHEGSNLRYRVIAKIMDHFFSSDQPSEASANNITSPNVEQFVGRYRWLSSCASCPVDEQDLIWEIKAIDERTLSMLGREWKAVAPYFFESENGEGRLGFRPNEEGEIQYMFLGNVDAFEKIKD